jgi:hypothetical protein
VDGIRLERCGSSRWRGCDKTGTMWIEAMA